MICFTRAASCRSAAVPGQPEPVPVICGQRPAAGYLLHLDNPSQYR
ncbi:hypothetical protein O23A_P3p0049 (plasmid) [Aeromonas salmonicida]|nr:hypothetical protein O23A_P3p0049 [Aeromonas salmonicida]